MHCIVNELAQSGSKPRARRRANILTGDLLEVMDGLPKAERERVAAVIEEVEDAVSQCCHTCCVVYSSLYES